jgi:hypothetical protein
MFSDYSILYPESTLGLKNLMNDSGIAGGAFDVSNKLRQAINAGHMNLP